MRYNTVRLPYWREELKIRIPESWDTVILSINDRGKLGDEKIVKAIREPIGSENLRELAHRSKKAVIIVEDFTRPSPTEKLVSYVAEELIEGGLREEDIRITMAIGAHRPPTKSELVEKIGGENLGLYEFFHHNIYENLVYIGETEKGTPVYLNKFVAEADLKIGIGTIIPHLTYGFGGGGKIILPGVVGIETIYRNHLKLSGELGEIEGNDIRLDSEEAAELAGLDFIVNTLINSSLEIVGLFSGDPIRAHREAIPSAKEIYSSRKRIEEESFDVVLANAYPLDIDLYQAVKALPVGSRYARRDGVIVLVGACPDGLGYHALVQPGGRMWRENIDYLAKLIGGRRIYVLSRNLNKKELFQRFGRIDLRLFHDPEELIKILIDEFGESARCLIAPYASITIP